MRTMVNVLAFGGLILAVGFSVIAIQGDENAGASLGMSRAEINREFQRGAGPKYCPGPGPTRKARKRPGGWNVTQALVGRTLARAEEVAKRRGCAIRIVKRDGIPQAVTDDLRYNRINVSVVKRTTPGKSYWMVKRIVDIA